MNKTDNLHALDRFGARKAGLVAELSHEGKNDGIGPTLLLAIGLRETWLQNVAGDGGHGRGVFQIDDRSHGGFLTSHKGCRSGEYSPVFPTVRAGAVPTLTDACRYAVSLLRANVAFAASVGVPAKDRLRFAVAAYNCGAGNARAAYKNGGISAVDRYTAGGDYSKDVLARMEVTSEWCKKHHIS